jgi:hypothetical protein
MNYDNLHTAAHILAAFQRCRDVREEINLFEALAWRDIKAAEQSILDNKSHERKISGIVSSSH